MDKKVCLSLKELYENGIKKLHYGGEIFYSKDGDNDYYDLRKKRNDSDIIACDGEEYELEIKTSAHVVLRSLMTNNSVWLSIEEYNIGVFFIPSNNEVLK